MKKINQNGFTLIEVLISILLLAIILTGGISFYTNSTEAMTLAMHKKIVTEMAVQEMELMKDALYTSLPNPATGCTTATAVTFGDFSVQKQRCVTDEPGGGATPNKKVEMKFVWIETGKQTSREIDLATYMAP